MKLARWILGAVCSLVLLVPLTALADNTTVATASSIMIGGTPVESFFNAGRTASFYRANVVAGRSYCAETQSGFFFDAGANEFDTVVTILAQDGITARVTSDDSFDEPQGALASRACFRALVSEQTFIRVVPFTSGDVFNWRMRMVETTLWLPWFFTGGDYTSFVLIRNTTNTAVGGVVVRTRNLAGAITSTSAPATIGADASLPFQIPAAAFPNGTVEVAHSGSPQALVCTGTSLSLSTGLSFDTICFQRVPW